MSYLTEGNEEWKSTWLCLGGCGECEHQTVLVVHYRVMISSCLNATSMVGEFFHEVAEEGVMLVVACPGSHELLHLCSLSALCECTT